ncbi:MAG: hypothetical protein M3303_15565 [Gemmatimonadota bacterium]|nr:hypothetical protein [Gemmatimonadota bacterium]
MRSAARALRSPALAGPAALALLALLASGASLANGFVYDDTPIIARNPRVHTLAQWWDIFASAYWPRDRGSLHYRPLTVLSFAVQWALGDGAPIVFHAVSVALYVATCVAVLALARLVLPAAAAWVVAALFAVHPVHVEAVANVVGQSELIVALCAVLAVAAYLRPRLAGHALSRRSITAIAALYAIGCLAKESGFLLPALLVAAELTIVGARLEPGRRTLRARARQLWPIYSACAAIGVAYLLARRGVLGGLTDEPNAIFWRLSRQELVLTMLGVVPEWARLLLWPAHLAADYSPPWIPLLAAPTPAVVAGVVIIAGAVLLSVAAWRLRAPVATFGVLWFAIMISPVSNVVVPSGVLLAERTLFAPSIGVMLALGAVWAWAGARLSTLGRTAAAVVGARAAFAMLAVLLVLGIGKSASRSRAWRDVDTFHERLVEDAPLSYKAHQAYGTWLFTKHRRAEGERHLRTAIAMFPNDPGPYADLADLYRLAGMCAPAHELYRRVIELGGLVDRARLGRIVCLLREADYAEAAAQARLGVSQGGTERAQYRRFLAKADSGAAAGLVVRQAGAPRPRHRISNAP